MVRMSPGRPALVFHLVQRQGQQGRPFGRISLDPGPTAD